ncbi:hypothetical protein AVEN_243927-1 [Araneus ventricosus]|uniref:Uncharacterized protein n=1 Tax=Araneus ventricosus TaxID=182803 RepID=A0A4Y2LV25_ARAVE|nr:hypothetical protein AVEN_217864-1 [Araneus ventricosus]GBN18642.1 hypothetical protein AVEN_243927-1 [Araneus ventricosus]
MGRNKGPHISRLKANPRYNRASRSQCLRRAREKEALMELCKPQQIINENFQDCCSQEITNIDSVPTTSREILNPHEENKRSDFLQNAIIIDSFSVIKTEIIDPSEKNPGLIFQDDSQYVTAIDSMPVVDSSRTNQKLLLPNIKVEPGSEAPFLPNHPQTNRGSASSKKENIGFNHAINYNKMIKRNVPTIKSKSVCGCFEKIAMIRHLCESYLELVQQDNTNRLCLCKAGNCTLPEDIQPMEKLMKKLSRLLNPDFGKVTCCMNEIDYLVDQSF